MKGVEGGGGVEIWGPVGMGEWRCRVGGLSMEWCGVV